LPPPRARRRSGSQDETTGAGKVAGSCRRAPEHRKLTNSARASCTVRCSTLLDVSFAGRGDPAGDADIALLAGVAGQV